MMGAQPEPWAHLLAAPGTPTWELLGDQLSEPAAYPVEARREKMAKPQFVKIRNLLKRKKGWAKPGWGSLARGMRLSRDAKPGAGGVPATAADERGAWVPVSSGY